MTGEIALHEYDTPSRCGFHRCSGSAGGVYRCGITSRPSEWNNLFKDSSDVCLINRRNKIDGIELLRKLCDSHVKVVFFDPQYRRVLDKLSYGNEGVRRGRARSELPQMSFSTVSNFLLEIERVLLPSGYLFLWVDKFHLVEGITSWLSNTPSISPVDMVTWNKQRMGMGYRTRRQAEYLVVLQKNPLKAKLTWHSHDIPDVWSEKVTKVHPHSKPHELQKKLILATTDEGDVVCDPAAGGYSVLDCCSATGRPFIGVDLIVGDDA